MSRYTFTQNWFYTCDLQIALTRGLLDPAKPWRVLEIGCLEGSATTFLSDTVLDHPESRMTCVDPFDDDNPTTLQGKGGNYTKNVFLNNIAKSKNHSKIELVELYSNQFYEKNDKTYNFIYIDGSHLVEDVALDFQKCLEILEPGGIMWMDDYLWGDGVSIRDRVDGLYEENKDKLEIIHKRYQIGFRRKQ
jgi:predicted O-methyltransferase YrrM